MALAAGRVRVDGCRIRQKLSVGTNRQKDRLHTQFANRSARKKESAFYEALALQRMHFVFAFDRMMHK